MTDTTDPKLLARIKAILSKRAEKVRLTAQEQIDWEEFFRLYYTLIGRFARAARCPKEGIDDLVYDVFRQVAQKLLELDYNPARGRFRSWLFRIVKSKTIDAVRRLSRTRRLFAGQQDTAFWHNLADPDGELPPDQWERAWEQQAGRLVWEKYRQEVREAVEQGRGQSRARELRVIEACVRDGRSAVVVAQELGLEPSHVRKLKERGRFRLRVIAAELFGLSASD